uniref:Venom protein n=1 Tax=Hemiscolopendra marginata TaxID=943146 RepID=A0A646QDY4_9MYRI
MMFSLILAIILAAGVFRIQAEDDTVKVFKGSCPDIVGDSLEGVEGRWFTVYSTDTNPQVICSYGDIVNLGKDKVRISSVFRLNNGTSLRYTSSVGKEADGKYYYTLEDSAGQHGPTMMKVDGDFLLTWNCYDFGDGNHIDVASVHSKNHQTSEIVRKKLSNMIDEKGSHAGQLLEVSHENCSPE